MKKFLFRVLLPTVVISITVLCCVELYLRSLPNDFKLKANYLDKHASEIKILVNGASCSAMGIKASCFDWQPSFSCAYVNQSIYYSYLIFNKYINQMDSLKYLVLDAPYAGLWGTGKAAKTYVKRYYIYYGLHCFSGFENRYEISANIKDILKKLIHVSDQAAFTTCEEDGFQSRYFEDIPYDDEKWRVYGKSHCVNDHTLINSDNAKEICLRNTEYLKQMISTCKDKGIKVVLVSTPCHPYYYEYYNPVQKKISDSTYNALCNEFDNVKWLDLTTSDEYSIDDFINVNHLNTQGAIKLTKTLNDSIATWSR